MIADYWELVASRRIVVKSRQSELLQTPVHCIALNQTSDPGGGSLVDRTQLARAGFGGLK